jgi:phospholipase/carboxylesterase
MRRAAAFAVVLTTVVVSTVACDAVDRVSASLAPLGGTYDDGRLLARPHPPTQEPPAPGRHELEIGGHRALLYVPTSATADRRSPFALLLHGASGQAEGGFRMWAPFAERAGVILLSPESQHGGAWDAMVGGFGSDVAMIDEELEWVFDRFRIRRSRMAIGGFSNGATYALSLGLTNGDLFTHVAAMSPGFMVPGELTGKPPVFISHGTRDRVLPINETSREIVPELRGEGYDVTFVTFDGGHSLERRIARRALRWFLGTR